MKWRLVKWKQTRTERRRSWEHNQVDIQVVWILELQQLRPHYLLQKLQIPWLEKQVNKHILLHLLPLFCSLLQPLLSCWSCSFMINLDYSLIKLLEFPNFNCWKIGVCIFLIYMMCFPVILLVMECWRWCFYRYLDSTWQGEFRKSHMIHSLFEISCSQVHINPS